MSVYSKVSPGEAIADRFAAFVADNEPRLRQSLCAALGSQAGREATADALAYGWEHWERVSKMANPAGYLYKVGRSRGRRQLKRRDPVISVERRADLPDFEPALPQALASLPERQRMTVMLVHCFQWSLGEVAAHLEVSKGTVQKHLERGMASLRQDLGVTS